MKKLLTVLLVIAVMFTFSFGSAMAATPTNATSASLYTEALNYAVNTVASAAFDKAVKDGINVDGVDVTAEAWATVKADYLEKLTDDFGLADNGDYPDSIDANAVLAKEMTTEANAYAIFGTQNWYTAENMSKYLLDNAQGALWTDAARAEYKLELDEAYDILANKIDLDAYEGDNLKAVKDAVKAIVEDLDETVDGTTTVTSYKKVTAAVLASDYMKHVTPGTTGGAMATVVKEYWSSTVGGFTATAGEYETGKYLISGIDTIADKDHNKVGSEASKAVLKAKIAQAVANEYVKTPNAPDETKKIWESYKTVMNTLIDEGIVTSANIDGVNGAWPAYKTALDDAEKLKAEAAKYAAEKDAEGKLVRDAKDVQDIVDDATLDIYQYVALGTYYTTKEHYNLDKAIQAIEDATIVGAASGLEFEKKFAIAKAEDAADAKKDICYDAEDAKVDTALATAKAAIEAATKTSEIEKAEYDYNRALKAIKEKSAIDADFVSAPISTEIAAQARLAKNYVDYVNSGKATYAADKILGTEDEIKELLADYYIEKGARTAAEVKSMALEASAIAAMLPTVESKAASLKAAEDAIKALPVASKVTTADQTAIENAIALVKAAKDAGNTTVTGESKLSGDIDALETALKAALWQDYSKVDKNDKVALRTLQEKVDDFNKLYKEDGVLEENAQNSPFAISAIDTDLEKIRKAELDAVDAAIKAIPINVTEADKATVESARKLYDAYVADWTSYEGRGHNAANDVEGFRTLALAEATLGLNAVSPAELVKGLKITAKSTAKKGSITVKWTVKGEADIDGYEIWKSTKANKGYKKAFTTTKKTYKNSKGLKKGTRYYYKVRAYKVIDGVKVTSDWSNKANRKAK